MAFVLEPLRTLFAHRCLDRIVAGVLARKMRRFARLVSSDDPRRRTGLHSGGADAPTATRKT